MANLAATYRYLGQFEEAKELEVLVLEQRKKLLGDHHLYTLTAMANLAATYRNLAQFDKAK
ncbi:hypothetical protein GGX14DRAFT_429582, partial [Mycena pura]